jgi:hypothetical protein
MYENDNLRLLQMRLEARTNPRIRARIDRALAWLSREIEVETAAHPDAVQSEISAIEAELILWLTRPD